MSKKKHEWSFEEEQETLEEFRRILKLRDPRLDGKIEDGMFVVVDEEGRRVLRWKFM
jgi:hypothetical protein